MSIVDRKFFSYSHLIQIFIGFIALSYAETISIASYNLLNFPEVMGMQRIDDYRIVVEYIETDILVVQEMQSAEGVQLFLDSVLNYDDDLFDAIPFNDGYDTDNALFYRSDNTELVSTQYIATPNRDIAEYRLKILDWQGDLYIFSVHFKSSQGTSNEMMRLQEATILRNHLDSLPPGTNVLVMGDFNIYYSDEAAFQQLTADLDNNNGRLYDPLSALGTWHENSDFAYIHTQSTRVEQLEDGGAGGGLDDRFDMVLCSQSLLDSADLYLPSQSYMICGNDGDHFNLSVNEGFNQSVPDAVADALYYSSDHLPVLVSIMTVIGQGVPEDVVKIWPNPMQHETNIQFPWIGEFREAKITIMNILGQRMYEAETRNPFGFVLKGTTLPIGIYFVHTIIESKYTTYHYRTRLAVTK